MKTVQVLVETTIEQILFRLNALFVEVLTILKIKKKKIRKHKEKARTAGDSYKQQTEPTPCRFFGCVSVYNLISKCRKPPKNKEKRQNTINFNEMGNRVFQKESKNSDTDNYLNIYAYMAQMSDNDKSYGKYFGDSS